MLNNLTELEIMSQEANTFFQRSISIINVLLLYVVFVSMSKIYYLKDVNEQINTNINKAT